MKKSFKRKILHLGNNGSTLAVAFPSFLKELFDIIDKKNVVFELNGDNILLKFE